MVAPSPVSGLLHAVAVVKSGVFGFIRVVGVIFGPELFHDIGAWQVLSIMAAITILVSSLLALKQDHINLSLEDVSVFFLSRKHKAMILSNDGPLRILADDSGIEYHGTLWLLDEMVKSDIIPPDEAITALKQMLNSKRWLPRQECERLIKKWESGE
jgi:predicted nucleic acid-binding protein